MQDIRQIIFTGNFLRFPGGHFATHILHRLLENVLGAAAGVEPVFTCPGISDAGYQQYLQELEAGGIRREEAWIKFQEETAELPESIQAILRPWQDLVIGFELPPSICQWLSQANLPYLNFFIHPVRFLPDLVLAVATNDERLGQRLSPYSFNLAVAYEQVGVMRALCLGDAAKLDCVEPGAAVFFGQTLGDSSVVANQRTVCALDYLPALREAAKRHASFILAPHPYEKFSVAMQLLRELGKGTIVNCNSYALLGHPNVESVITLSSSLGREAEFFGKKTTFLLGDPLRPGGSLVPRDAKLFTLGHTVLTELFWRDVLGLAAPEHAGLISPNLFHAPNLFRSLFGGWAYDQLDPVLRRKNALDKTYIHPQPWKRIEYRQTGLPEEQVIYYHPKQLKLDFRASGNGFLYTSAGFSMAEKFGTWTEGTCAELVVPADLVKPGTTAISFRLQPFVNHEATQQRVKLSVNHIPAGEFGLQAQGEYRVMFTLPASEPPTEYCSICFELPDACSPQALGLSSDSRLLGLRLIEAELVQDANSFNEVIITKVETNISGEMENPLLLENQALKQAQQAVEQENQALKQAQQAVEQENQVLADEVKRIHAGWSWRVTAPLRQGKQVVHRFLTLIFHP